MYCEDVELEKLLNQIMQNPEDLVEDCNMTKDTNNSTVSEHCLGPTVSGVSSATIDLIFQRDELVHNMEDEHFESLGFSKSPMSLEASLPDYVGAVSLDSYSPDSRTNTLGHHNIRILTKTISFMDHTVHPLDSNDKKCTTVLIPGLPTDMISSTIVASDIPKEDPIHCMPCSLPSDFAFCQSSRTIKPDLSMQKNVIQDDEFSHNSYFDAMSDGKSATALDEGSHGLRDHSINPLCYNGDDGWIQRSNSYSNDVQVSWGRSAGSPLQCIKDTKGPGPIHKNNSYSSGVLTKYNFSLNSLLSHGLNMDEIGLCSHDYKMNRSPGYLLDSYVCGKETKHNDISFIPKNGSYINPRIPSYLQYGVQMGQSIQEEERQQRMQPFLHHSRSLKGMRNHDISASRNPIFSSCVNTVDDGGKVYSPHISSADWRFQILQRDNAICCRPDELVYHGKNHYLSESNRKGILSGRNEDSYLHSQLMGDMRNITIERILNSRSSLCEDQKKSSCPVRIPRKSHKAIAASISSPSTDSSKLLIDGSLKGLTKPDLCQNLSAEKQEAKVLYTEPLKLNLRMLKDALEPELRYKSLAEVEGHILSVAKDQYGCRFLQKKFDEGAKEDVEKIFTEVIHHAVELMMDAFGNYLIQKILDVCNEDQRLAILKSLTNRGELINVSLNLHGTRAVQKLIETLKGSNQISAVAEALRPGVIALIKDLNGNHVIQRCLQHLSIQDNQFIFEAATNNCVEIATHRHGCCVLQRCIDYSTGASRQHLISEIATNSLLLSQDPFGNYVVQYVLELDSSWASNQVMDQLSGNFSRLSTQKFSSNVVEKCLKLSDSEKMAQIVQELINSTHLPHLLQDPFANYVIQSALTVSKGDVHTYLVEAIRPHMLSLRSSPYGKRILSRRNLRKR